MKILAISDQRLPEMEYPTYLKRTYSDVEVLFSCGDLEASYLELVSSVLNIPLFYVRGNHDTGYAEGYPGGENLHLRYIKYRGITMAGLEGSMYYNGRNVQYSEAHMFLLCLRMLPRLIINRLIKGYGVTYLVTHSPPRGIHDRQDVAHQGFRSFLWLIRLGKPRYLVHGHIDIWDNREIRETNYFRTKVININPKRVLFPFEDGK